MFSRLIGVSGFYDHKTKSALSLVAVEGSDRVEMVLAGAFGEEIAQEADEILDSIERQLLGRHEAGGTLALKGRGDSESRLSSSSNKTFIQLFREQVEKSPQNIALVGSDESMTYQELEARSDLWSEELRQQGIGPGQIVAIFADRKPQTVVGILAVLKARAAYLPIDPQYPQERVEFMLSDAQVSLCITQDSYRDRVRSLFRGEVRVLDSDEWGLGSASSTVQGTRLQGSGEDLAYIIYTSGSTGKPKGVEIENHSLGNYLQWASHAYEVKEDSRFALFTSLSFDLTITSLFLPLICGGSVELFEEDLGHITLQKIMENEAINSLKLTPTHLDLMARLGLSASGIRMVVVGGEQLKRTTASQAQKFLGPGCKIINEYGPTEATVGCVTHVFNLEKDSFNPRVPIGLPIDGMMIDLLDGEIYISGKGLAKGYLNRKELTQERFVYLSDGRRAYRTGDLGRVLENGELEYLGRLDQQIKIRGHRVEPGEIEAELLKHPSIHQAIVLGRARKSEGELSLCAYYVSSVQLDELELRMALTQRLPNFLVPSFFFRVDFIPMTVNGKVDVQALPFSDVEINPTQSEGLNRDPRERAVFQIWSEALGINENRLTDDSNFYHLGGDSLQMVEVVSKISKMFFEGQKQAERMYLRSILRNPTLGQFRPGLISCEEAVHDAHP